MPAVGAGQDDGRLLALGADDQHLGVAEQLTVPYGPYETVVVTRDWSPLEAGVADHKHYAPGVGMIREEAVEGETSRLDLVSFVRGSDR